MRTILIAVVLLAGVTSFAAAQVNSGHGNSNTAGGPAAAMDSGGKTAAKTTAGTRTQPKSKPATSENQAAATRGAHANSTGSHTTGSSLTSQSAGQSKNTTGR